MSVPELIVMLTHNDVTVKNAKEIFLEAGRPPVSTGDLKMSGFRRMK